jgi:hypothetical protein
LDSVRAPAAVFAEMNKAFSRIFDASITDACNAADYNTRYFAVGVSANRVNQEALAFSGTPVSVLGVQATVGANPTTLFFTIISDMQLAFDASGAVEIIR